MLPPFFVDSAIVIEEENMERRDFLTKGLVGITGLMASQPSFATIVRSCISGRETASIITDSKYGYIDGYTEIGPYDKKNGVPWSLSSVPFDNITVELCLTDRTTAGTAYLTGWNYNGYSFVSNYDAYNARLGFRFNNAIWRGAIVPYTKIPKGEEWQFTCAMTYAEGITILYLNGEYFLSNRRTWDKNLALSPSNNVDAYYHSYRVYGRALNADEIAHNYDIDKERFGI